MVDKNWVEEMVKSLKKHEIVAPRMDHLILNKNNIYAELKSGWQNYGLVKNRLKPSLYHAGTSGLGIRSNLHAKIDGFDETFLAGEDWDYCWRAQLNGSKLHFEPNAVIHIRHRDNFKELVQQSILWGEYYVLLTKKYQHLNLSQKSTKEYILDWKILLSNFKKVSDERIRCRLFWDFSYKVGKFKGLIKSFGQ